MIVEAEICTCSALRQAARHATRLYDAALAPVDLGLNQYAVLARLKRFGSMRLAEFASRLVMDRSSLGHLLRPLEARGLVSMRPDERDRRGRLIALTKAGEALLERALPLWAAVEEAFSEALGTADAQALRSMLKGVEQASISEHRP